MRAKSILSHLDDFPGDYGLMLLNFDYQIAKVFNRNVGLTQAPNFCDVSMSQ